MLQGNAVCSAASYRESSKPLKLLLDSGCEPTFYENRKQDMSAIFMAAKAKQWGNVRLLIERGAKVEKRLLHMAALDDEIEMIELLLAQNLSHITIDAGVQPEACLLFLDHGRKFRNNRPAPLHELWTPLHFAAWSTSANSTAALLRHGAQVNKPTSVERWTAVHLAIAGPQTSSRDNFQATLALIKILVDNGADVNLPKKGGTKAYDLAQSFPSHKDLKDCHNFLRSLGAVGTVYNGAKATAPRPRR